MRKLPIIFEQGEKKKKEETLHKRNKQIVARLPSWHSFDVAFLRHIPFGTQPSGTALYSCASELLLLCSVCFLRSNRGDMRIKKDRRDNTTKIGSGARTGTRLQKARLERLRPRLLVKKLKLQRPLERYRDEERRRAMRLRRDEKTRSKTTDSLLAIAHVSRSI